MNITTKRLLQILAVAACLVSVAECFEICGLIFYPPRGRRRENPLPVPLTAVDVNADIRGWTVGVTAELSYKNVNDDNVECEFVFPLSDSSAVYRLDAVIAGRNLSAQLKEREAAKQEYKQALKEGRKTVLLENEKSSPNVFRLKLGNLPPNQTAKVTIGFVEPLERSNEDGELSYTLPVVLNPRYVPRHEVGNKYLLEQRFQVKYVAVSEVEYRMAFHAKVSLGLSRQIVDIKSHCLNDTLNVLYGQNKLTASVDLVGDFIQDHDFQLLITPSRSAKPMVYVEPGKEVTTAISKTWLNVDIAAAWFEPQPAVVNDKKLSNDEYWFVVDRSQSMAGEKMTVVQSALKLAMKSLPFGSKFNIVGFGLLAIRLFPKGVVDYSEEAVKKALIHIDDIDADMAATELLDALKIVADSPVRSDVLGARRFVFLLTDGEVANTDEIITFAKKNVSTTRIFAVGIGNGANSALVKGISRNTNGLSEIIRGMEDRWRQKMVSLLRATTEPSAENVNLTWDITNGFIQSTLPKTLPTTAVYSGGSITQYAVIERNPEKDATGYSKFTATVEGEEIESRLPFEISSNSFSDSDDPLPLHRLSAKMMLTQLSDEYKADKSEEIKNESIAISLATGVLCEFTAFVAVDRDEQLPKRDDNKTKSELIHVQVERPTAAIDDRHAVPYPVAVYDEEETDDEAAEPEWRGKSSALEYAADFDGYSHDRMAFRTTFSGFGGRAMLTTGFHEMGGVGMAPTTQSLSVEPSKASVLDETKELPRKQFDSLIDLQTFKGSWHLTTDFLSILNVASVQNADHLRAKVTDAVRLMAVADMDDEFVATATAVSMLRHGLAAYKDEWLIAESKALNYLRSFGYEIDFDAFFAKIASNLGGF